MQIKMKKQKILISIATLIISSVIGVLIINQTAPTPFEGAELFLFYLLEMGMILITPFMAFEFIKFAYNTTESAIFIFLFLTAILSLIWWIYLLIKGKRKWIIIIPVLIWVVVGSITTLNALCMSV